MMHQQLKVQGMACVQHVLRVIDLGCLINTSTQATVVQLNARAKTAKSRVESDSVNVT